MIENEIALLLEYKIMCVDCKEILIAKKKVLECKRCKRLYRQKKNGVWDFTQSKTKKKLLDIYREPMFQKWKRVFKKQEVFNWSIYDSKFKRMFSQAGHRKIAKLIDKRVGNKCVLEIGAGNGALLKFLRPNNYIGIDFSDSSLAMLKTNYKSAIVICVDDNFIPFGKNLFEIIVSLHTMEHIYGLGEHIEEIKRLLRDRGKYYFVIPTEGGLAFWLGRQLFTGPHLRSKYNLDVNYVMDREHINDAKRVIKFLKLYFGSVSKYYWPMRAKLLSINAMIYGYCVKD